MDGKRLIVACTPQHLHHLAWQYAGRPFVVEELWAGKLARALGQAAHGLQPEQLAAATGLTTEQIEQAVTWHNTHIA